MVFDKTGTLTAGAPHVADIVTVPHVTPDERLRRAPRVALAGSDARTFTAPVASSVTHVKVAISHPLGAVLGINGPFSYTVTVRDAAGAVLGTTTETSTAIAHAPRSVGFSSRYGPIASASSGEVQPRRAFVRPI